METLDVSGLPEPVVRGLEVVAQMARDFQYQDYQAHIPLQPADRPAVQLHIQPGTACGQLTREEIYDDL